MVTTARDIPLVDDKDAPHRQMDFISKEDLKVYEVKPFAWDESSGGVWKWSADQDAVTGFGKVYFNLGTSNRKALASLRDIEVTGIRR